MNSSRPLYRHRARPRPRAPVTPGAPGRAARLGGPGRAAFPEQRAERHQVAHPPERALQRGGWYTRYWADEQVIIGLSVLLREPYAA